FAGHFTAGGDTPAGAPFWGVFFFFLFSLWVGRGGEQSFWWAGGAAVVGCLMTPGVMVARVFDPIKPIFHLGDFLVGIAAARLFDLTPAHWGKWLYRIGLAGSAVIIGYAPFLPEWISMTTLLRPMNAVLLLGLARGGGWVARVLSARPIAFLGKASYALYILHIPILWWAVSWPGYAVRYLYVAFVIAA